MEDRMTVAHYCRKTKKLICVHGSDKCCGLWPPAFPYSSAKSQFNGSVSVPANCNFRSNLTIWQIKHKFLVFPFPSFVGWIVAKNSVIFSVKYDEVVNHCINKTLIFIMMHYGLNTNQTRYKYFIKHIKRY